MLQQQDIFAYRHTRFFQRAKLKPSQQHRKACLKRGVECRKFVQIGIKYVVKHLHECTKHQEEHTKETNQIFPRCLQG